MAGLSSEPVSDIAPNQAGTSNEIRLRLTRCGWGGTNMIERVSCSSLPVFLFLVGLLSVSGSVALQPASQQVGGSPNPIPSTFFGMHINRPNTPWPQVPFGSLRMLGNMTPWFHLEGSGRGHYDWHNLDVWLGAARTHHLDRMC